LFSHFESTKDCSTNIFKKLFLKQIKEFNLEFLKLFSNKERKYSNLSYSGSSKKTVLRTSCYSELQKDKSGIPGFLRSATNPLQVVRSSNFQLRPHTQVGL
jgi:hypothetical protein